MKVLKDERGKNHETHKIKLFKITADFSIEMLKPRIAWSDTF